MNPADQSGSDGRRWLSAVGATIARRPTLWITLAALLLLATLGLLQARGPLIDGAEVRRMDIEQHLVASGRVRAATRMQLTAQAAGRITEVAVREGRRVQPGDLLLRIDDREARAGVAEARAAVAQARGRVAQLREVSGIVADEQLREAEANATRAESEFARVAALAKAGAMADRDLEDARLALDVAVAARTAARARQQGSAAEGAEARVAEGALRESEARLAAAEVRLAQTRLVASQPGLILSRHVDPGDIVRVGDTLFELAGEGGTEVVIEPDERNLAWLRVGQPARVSADAYPDRIVDAQITYIAPAVDSRRGSIEVRLGVPDPPDTLRPDMTVSVDLTVARKDATLTLPSDAIRDGATSPWVLVANGGVLARRSVTLGIAGEGRSEIASGLSEGEIVALSSVRALEPGQRVRLRVVP